jgi:hypothetical protein
LPHLSHSKPVPTTGFTSSHSKRWEETCTRMYWRSQRRTLLPLRTLRLKNMRLGMYPRTVRRHSCSMNGLTSRIGHRQIGCIRGFGMFYSLPSIEQLANEEHEFRYTHGSRYVLPAGILGPDGSVGPQLRIIDYGARGPFSSGSPGPEKAKRTPSTKNLRPRVAPSPLQLPEAQYSGFMVDEDRILGFMVRKYQKESTHVSDGVSFRLMIDIACLPSLYCALCEARLGDVALQAFKSTTASRKLLTSLEYPIPRPHNRHCIHIVSYLTMRNRSLNRCYQRKLKRAVPNRETNGVIKLA